MLTRTIRSFILRQLWSAGILLWLVCFASSTDLRVNIDDLNSTLRDPASQSTYSANLTNLYPTCASCHVCSDTDATSTSESSHANTTPVDVAARSVTLKFEGTTVHVYCVSSSRRPCSNKVVDVLFTLDGTAVGNYSSSDLQPYNISVYQNASLQDGTHELVLEARRGTSESIGLSKWSMHKKWRGDSNSTAAPSDQPQSEAPTMTTDTPNLSTAAYSSETPSSAPRSRGHSNDNNALIIGCVIGGFLGIVVAVLLALFIRRHLLLLRRQPLADSDSLTSKGKVPTIEPFMEFRYSSGAPHEVRTPRYLPQKGRLATAAPSWRWPASATAYSTEPGPSIVPPSTVSSGGMTHREALTQQVREMREEIRRLRDLALRMSKTAGPSPGSR